MKTADSSKGKPFQVSFCVFQDMGGSIRQNAGYPWADDMPRVFTLFESLARYTCLVMGPTTFQAFSRCKYAKKLILASPQNPCFILTRKTIDFPLIYPANVVTSLVEVRNIWHGTHRLEKIDRKKDEEAFILKRQRLIQEKKISPKEIYELKTKPYLGKAIVAIGGSKLYERILEYADTIYLFLICENFSGDTALPLIDKTFWEQDSNGYREYPADEKNKYSLLEVVWRRKGLPPKKLI